MLSWIFDKAMEYDPKCTLAYTNRGSAKSELKNYQGAIEDCDKAIELNPQEALAYINRGSAKHRLGQHREGNYRFRQGNRT